VLEWKRNGLNEVVGSLKVDGGRRTGRIEMCYYVSDITIYVLFSLKYFEQLEYFENMSDMVVF